MPRNYSLYWNGVSANIFLKDVCSYFKLALSAQYVSTPPVVLHTILDVWPLHMQIGEQVRNEKTKAAMLFLKLHIWLKVLTTYVYKLVIYATTQLTKKNTHLLVTPQQLSVSNIQEKLVIFLVTTNRDGTLAPAETLFIQVPLQWCLFH